jgi:mono/diheme cytochrome c family protein
MLKRILFALFGVFLVASTLVAALNFRDESTVEKFISSAALVERGRYLALVGNCAGCHTLPGSAAYAGGYGVPTPYGIIYASNLTPHKESGIGTWTSNDFWRALHNGRSKDGRFLYPAFPYTSYTKISQQDSNAIYAYLSSLPPSDAANKPNTLAFPYSSQMALGVWRALFFKPGDLPVTATLTDIDQGAYLVRAVGHCDACHAQRNRWGGVSDSDSIKLGGGVIPVLNWYAPSLTSPLITKDIATYLKIGKTQSHYASGPMAEVVYNSTQFLTNYDARAMQAYLESLPRDTVAVDKKDQRPATASDVGAKVYTEHCEACHGKNGEGIKNAYPTLVGNPAVLESSPASLVRMIIEGGFGATTLGNPRPYGMPPYGNVLSPLEIAGVITHIRSSFGNRAGFISEIEVIKYQSR